MTEPDELLVTSVVEGGVATITLDSVANRNALSARLLAQFAAALAAANDAASVNAIVITGRGPVFCSGADLADPPSNDPDHPFSLPDVLRSLLECPKPLVAHVNGHARAGGLGLIAACDISVASLDSTFAFSEVRIGLVPAIIAVVCQRVMSPRAFQRYALTGEIFDGAAAASCGLLSAAVQGDQLQGAVERVIAELHRTEPTAVTITKRWLAAVPQLPIDEAFARAAELSVERFASPEGREGIAALRGKRDPSWAW